ncbi:MAG: NAD(P)/FAD-dependent oxidoreductase [Rhizomicrobium sp.]
MTLSRRHLLGGGAALALAPLLARAAPPDLDVAIVGGGVSGAYAAWRLAREAPHLRLRLFEASDRIGGRLHSVAFPQAPHLVAEAGGMRFLEAHRHVFGLVGHLGLPSRDYPIDRDANRMMLRGRNFALKDVNAGRARFPYRVPDKDQTPQADYFGRAIDRILPGAAHMTPADWRKIRASYRYRNRPLNLWRNRDLLREGMSAEELALAQDSSGYDDWIDGETGLDEMDYFFVHDDESKPFRTLAGGYQRLPLTLAEQARKAGAGIAAGTRLVSLVPQQAGYRLTVHDVSNRQTVLTAKRVILALPRRGLEGIADFPEARADRNFARLIAGVTPIPACKSLLLYRRPWWRDHGIVEGRSVTDMPARQFYCLGSETARLPSEDTNGYGVLMAYSDMRAVAGWKHLVARLDPSGFTALPGDASLAREVHREAQLVIGGTALQPLAAYFQDWSADPFGGGWHYYALGHDGVADSAAMLQPMPSRGLYVCGEAYSQAQGWVEGALERAETMLQRHFGLRAPGWLKS